MGLNSTPIKERILYFIEKQGIKKKDFLDSIGMHVSNFKSPALQSEIGGDKLSKIMSSYPELSAEWLLTGNGSMLKQVPILPYAEKISNAEELEEENKCLRQMNDTILKTLNQINEVREENKELREENKRIRSELELLKKDFPNKDEYFGEEREYHEQTSLSTCISSTPMMSDTTESEQLV